MAEGSSVGGGAVLAEMGKWAEIKGTWRSGLVRGLRARLARRDGHQGHEPARVRRQQGRQAEAPQEEDGQGAEPQKVVREEGETAKISIHAVLADFPPEPEEERHPWRRSDGGDLRSPRTSQREFFFEGNESRR